MFPERFSHFTLPYFPGTGAAEQLDSAGCSSWWFPKCCEQGMPALLFLNIHSMSAACVKVFAPLSLKTTKLFNTHIYKTCSWSNLGLLAHLKKLPRHPLEVNLLFPALAPQTKPVVLYTVKGWDSILYLSFWQQSHYTKSFLTWLSARRDSVLSGSCQEELKTKQCARC